MINVCNVEWRAATACQSSICLINLTASYTDYRRYRCWPSVLATKEECSAGGEDLIRWLVRLWRMSTSHYTCWKRITFGVRIASKAKCHPDASSSSRDSIVPTKQDSIPEA